MALFTASVTGDWNKGATWGNGGDVEGVDFPDEDGTDTFAINTGVVVTIPSSYLLAHSSGSFDGELVINGKLKLSANTTVNEDADGWTMGPGSTLDVNGFDWIQDGSSVDNSTTPITLVGTSASRITIMSSSTNGNILYTGTLERMWGTHNIQYVDISGCTTITLAAYQTAGQNITIKNVTFTGYNIIRCLASVALTANYTLDGIDLRDTVGATQRWDWGNAYGTDTGTRIFRNITLSNAGELRNTGLDTSTHGTTLTNLIVHNSKFLNAGLGNLYVDGWFIDDDIAVGGQHDVYLNSYKNGYYYSDLTNAHPFDGSANSIEFTDNIVECIGVDTSSGGDGIIFGSDFTGTVNILRNIWLWGSDGSVINAVGSTPSGVVNFDHNTVIVTTQAANSIIDNAPLFIKSQSADWAGTVNCRSNIAHFVGGITAPTRAAGITLQTTTADQIDNVDYNVFGLPDIWNEYNNVVITGKTYPEAGFGGSDLYVNSSFVDETRTLAKWDSSLSGAGTAINAITEMLKYNSTTFNSNYTIANAIAYVQAGFAPQNEDLKDAGHDGVTVGAIEYRAPLSYGARGLTQRMKKRRSMRW
jgi:hypothetical protein